MPKTVERRQVEKPGVKELKAIITKFKLTSVDINLALKSVNSKGKAQSKLRGQKVKPKYRNSKGETWAGRGLKPKWVVAALKSGKKLEDFAI